MELQRGRVRGDEGNPLRLGGWLGVEVERQAREGAAGDDGVARVALSSESMEKERVLHRMADGERTIIGRLTRRVERMQHAPFVLSQFSKPASDEMPLMPTRSQAPQNAAPHSCCPKTTGPAYG